MKAKKFCIIALVLAIALLIVPISESKAEEEPDVKTSGDYEYIVLKDETACIIRYNGEDAKVIVPEEIDGIKVTGIGYRAFSWKDNLKEITIPDSVENIGINPFIACFYLSNINISVDHPTLEFIDNALIYKPEKRLVSYLSTSEESKYEIPEGIKIIGDGAFDSCSNLTEINIPESVKSIGDRAFMFCGKLTEVNVPDGVQAIGNDAFRECKNIKEINLPDSLQSIGNFAFARCVNIKEIKIPDSIKNIGINPFFYCTSLLNIEISDNHPTLEFIDNALIYKPEKKLVIYFSTNKESKYEIPNGIKIIGEVAFDGCKNLTEVKIPDSVQSIGYSAFYGCKNLRKINIPYGVQSIGDSAFSQCYNLTEINIPDGVQSIGDWAFCGCTSLSNINISDNHPTFEFIDNALLYKPEKKASDIS